MTIKGLPSKHYPETVCRLWGRHLVFPSDSGVMRNTDISITDLASCADIIWTLHTILPSGGGTHGEHKERLRMTNVNGYIFAIYFPRLIVLHAKIGQRMSYRSDTRLPILYQVMCRPMTDRAWIIFLFAGGEVNIGEYLPSRR